MTFSEEAAELHRFEAVALSLGLTEQSFEDVLLTVVAEGRVSGRMPADQLSEIRQRIREAAGSLRLVRRARELQPSP
ncbi:hypothetical protein ASF41_22755 [Methylobacterium sp. Leaf111]|uniref:hypothetical protein n=1 Tax=Methylobacterium sp. Leaf111 TaxID=1736257 RepID=UPI0006FAC583|nr:hypothetical protein [Methylobacterium sp. Leaf111]KQP61877.1 hypothetical protein ASF41_22755 [Methylobacterium sp. Leaf111]